MLDRFELAAMGAGAPRQWQAPKTQGAATTFVTVQQVGWIGERREKPAPQWIAPLSGRWFVEPMDGARAEMGPGEIFWGGDQNCATMNGRTGHRSGTVGDAPAVLFIVQERAS